MKKGAPSLNPSGRPKGAKGLAAYIAEQTDDGRELVDRLLQLARSNDAPARALVAIEALLDRLAGKPLAAHQVTALTASVQLDRPPPNWRDLSPEERRAAIAARLATAVATPAADLAALLPPGDSDE